MNKVRLTLVVSCILVLIPCICMAAWGGYGVPTISSISPTIAVAGAVTESLTGTNFTKIRKVSAYDASTRNLVGTASIVSTSSNKITILSQLPVGKYYFKVSTLWGTSNSSPTITLSAAATKDPTTPTTTTPTTTTPTTTTPTTTTPTTTTPTTTTPTTSTPTTTTPTTTTPTTTTPTTTTPTTSTPTTTTPTTSTPTTTTPTTSTPTTTTTTLAYSPPAMTNPYIIRNVSVSDLNFPRSGDPEVNTGMGGCFPPTLDVIIYLPTDKVITDNVSIKGGRNVRIIGGKWMLSGADSALVVDAITKSVFIEGAHIDMNNSVADGICLRNRPTSTVPGAGPYDVYLQNVRIEGNNYDGGGLHPDLLQDQSDGIPLGHLYIENFSGWTVDQGFFLPVRSATPHGSFYFKNVELHYSSNRYGSALIWLRDDGSQPVLPGTMDNVWVSDVYLANPSWPWYDIAVWPKTATWSDGGDPPFASWGTIPSADKKSVTFMPGAQITGKINAGNPPGGDFVEASEVGLNYRSPHD